jgi:hypothetical protein
MALLEYYYARVLQHAGNLLPRQLIDGVTYGADAPLVSHQRIVLKLAFAQHEHSSGGNHPCCMSGAAGNRHDELPSI